MEDTIKNDDVQVGDMLEITNPKGSIKKDIVTVLKIRNFKSGKRIYVRSSWLNGGRYTLLPEAFTLNEIRKTVAYS